MARGGYREGAGRKPGSGKGDGLASKVIRVSSEVTKADCEAIPSLKLILAHWEEECLANPGGARYHFLKQMIEEIRALGL
jgi:hypothetical protein